MFLQIRFPNCVATHETKARARSWISIRTQVPELLQQTASENAERQVELEEELLACFLCICFDVELRHPTTWRAVPVGMTNIRQRIPKLSSELWGKGSSIPDWDAAFHFERRHTSFSSRRLLRMLRSKLNWKRQVFSILFLCFDFELRTPTTWHGFVMAVDLMNMCTTASPIYLANHEARARTHQTEEEYKELQVGPCV